MTALDPTDLAAMCAPAKRKRGEAHDRILETLREHPDWCSTQIAAATGIGSGAVRTAARRLGIRLKLGYDGSRPNGSGEEEFAAYVRSILSYDPDTGVLTWRVARSPSVCAGTRAGVCVRGYVRVRLLYTTYAAHRLAWLITFGKWPNGDLDHINHVKDDNRIANLREATDSQNGANRLINRNSTSGFKGVYWHRGHERWYAHIKVSGRRHFLGSYDDPSEAHAAYVRAANELFGQFARAE